VQTNMQQLLPTHCIQKHHFVVVIAAEIFEKNFLIDDWCYQIKTRFLFNSFLSIKLLLVRTSFNNLEIVSPYEHVLGKLTAKFFSCTICMSLFSHNNDKWKLFVLNCISHEP
jgi:hypothetical protein